MGWFSDAVSFVADDVLGFDPPKAGKLPKVAAPTVATTEPATNTPTPAPAQASFDRVQSYLAIQSQRAFNEQIKQISTKQPASAPPTFSQTEQGQKLIRLGIIAALAWLFLFKGKL